MFPIDHFLRAAIKFPNRIAVKDGDTGNHLCRSSGPGERAGGSDPID